MARYVDGCVLPIRRAKPAETIVFAFVVFKSRAHRDSVNAKVMKDKRMTYGGFKAIVEA